MVKMEKTSVADVMERDAYFCRATDTLGEVTRQLRKLNVSSLPVIDEERHVVGFISDGDIMRAIAAHKTRSIFSGGSSSMVYFDDESFEEKARGMRDRNVMELAARKVLCATPEQSVGRVADLLSKKQFKKLPVIDEEGRLVGIVRRGSITRYLFHVLFEEE